MDYLPGTRVGAIQTADDTTVELFGYGTFDGYFVPPEEIRFAGSLVSNTNPRITLDNGKVVWGCECWWGPEEKIMAMVAGRTLVMVDIEKEREKYNKPGGQSGTGT
jgi:hypothetical protein